MAFLGARRDSGRCVFMAEPEAHWDSLSSLATQAARRARREGGGRIRLATVDTGAPDSRFANTGAPPVEQLGQATP